MTAPFGRVLIANRGEIAVRIARTLRQLGIRAQAIYSQADRDALHVRACDEAYPVGEAPGSYLDSAAVIAAARRAGAEAIHPGYGFLAENAAFAAAVAAAGITFIGPSPAAMHTMGDKTRARAAMVAGGVPCVPGCAPPADDLGEVERQARTLGFPVMIKAAAGGGGRGMRRVESAAELPAAWAAAAREARSTFGDGCVYLERALLRPRHLEVQVFGEADGTILTFGERECSLQRRHQKIVEESPSPVLDADGRRQLAALATRAARAVDYRGAGTVECLRDGVDGAVYFLEMNTRLQVEHPVTEMCWGIDLVEGQLRCAAGEASGLARAGRGQGHAIEARLCAEDPASGFLPAPGTIACLRWPSGPGVRVDAGVDAGVEVSAHYDPLIAKIVAHGQDREQARRRLHAALADTWVAGPGLATNLAFLRQLVGGEPFASGDYHTGTAALAQAEVQQPTAGGERRRQLAVTAAAIDAYRRDRERAGPEPGQAAARGDLGAWRLGLLGGA